MNFIKVKPNGQVQQGFWFPQDDHKIRDDKIGRDSESDRNHEDLSTSLRVFLRFGRLLGILPIDGLFSWNPRTEHLKVKHFGVAFFSSKLVSLMLAFNFCVGVVNMFRSKKETATELARSCSMALFYMMGSFTCIFIGSKHQQFVDLLKSWKKMKPLHFASHPLHKADVNLTRDTNWTAGLIFTSAILENALLFCLQSEMISIPNDDGLTVLANPKMDAYYRNSHPEWVLWVHDTPGGATTTAICLGYFVCICNKLGVCAWNYADTLVIILSRALYFKFKVLREVAEHQLLKSGPKSKLAGRKLGEYGEGGEGVTTSAACSAWEWTQLTIDHSILCRIVAEFAHFLSPLIFTCFATNIFFICLQIKLGLTSMSRTNFVSSLYFVWSFLHLVVRTFLVCLSAARINEHAHGVRKLYQVCPENAYSQAVQRADHFLGSTSLGLNGLGCFVITKPFMLTVIGVVFTFEIVLLTTN